MQNFIEKINCYSVFSPEFDVFYNKNDVLTKIRRDLFENNKKSKNKITLEENGAFYRYSYILEPDKPLKWKKMKDDVVIEKSRANDDGSYEIVTLTENKNVSKIIYFDKNHCLKKVEYLKDLYKNKTHTVVSCENIESFLTLTRYEDHGKIVSTRLYPVENIDEECLNNENVTFICETNAGLKKFCTNEQINLIKSMESKKEIMQIQNIENNDIKKDKDKIENLTDETQGSLDCWLNHVGCPYSNTFKKIIKTDKDEKYFYFGKLNGILRNGLGKTVTQDAQTVYEGEYSEDKRNGFGVSYHKSGRVSYVGGWKENKKNNLGISFEVENKQAVVSNYNDGAPGPIRAVFDNQGNMLFAGKTKDGIFDGAGAVLSQVDAKISIRKFKNGKMTNFGTLFDEEGNLLYNGELENNIPKGFGTQFNQDGTIKYKGFFKDGKYDGKGNVFLNPKRKIEGIFKDGLIYGTAVEYGEKNEKIYEGSWKDTLYDGEGLFYLKDGSFLKGTFKEGKSCGVFSKFNSNKELIYEGTFKDHKYDSQGTLYKDGKKFYEGEFKNGLANGNGCMFEDEKCIYKGDFKDGKRFGVGQAFENNKIKYIGNFEDDLFNGLGVLYENSTPKFVGEFSKGKRHGRINEIYRGCVVKECVFENDEEKYAREYEFPGMSLIYDGNIIDGKRNGMGCKFNAYGEKEQEGIFENGNLVTSMKVCLKEILPLKYCEELKNTDYEIFRFGPDFVVESPIGKGIYSGKLKSGLPDGKGSVLYSDHKYNGEFINGKPHGLGVIYKNDGTKVSANFVDCESDETKKLQFADGIEYNFIED